jgi:hypothetical protein
VYRKFSHKIQILHNFYANPENQKRPERSEHLIISAAWVAGAEVTPNGPPASDLKRPGTESRATKSAGVVLLEGNIKVYAPP